MAAVKVAASAKVQHESGETRQAVLSCVGLALLTTLALAPFAGKAFHIDDPIFLRIAEHLQNEPGDFYGFEMNWFGDYEPVYELNRNPPLLPYYLAAVMMCVGQSEFALHVAMIPAAVGVVLGTFLLARRCSSQPFLAALCTLASPFLLISATQVMCETMMTCFWVWSVLLWVRAHQDGCWKSVIAGGLVASLSIMTKFQGVCLVPLLLVYSITDRSRMRYSLGLLIPIGVVLGYEWLTHSLYGTGHFFSAAAHSIDFEAVDRLTLWEHLGISLSFTGGAVLPALFLVPWTLSLREALSLSTLATVVACGVALLGPSMIRIFEIDEEVVWSLVLQFALLVFSGCIIIWITPSDFARDRSRLSVLLVLWVLGVFSFAAFVNWSVNGRTLLPLVPAAAILLSRRFEARATAASTQRRRWHWAALLPALGAALLLTAADYYEARTAKTAAAEISEWCADRSGTVWFQGHWGFQWYMEHHGAKALDLVKPGWSDGDILVIPVENANVHLSHPARVLQSQVFEYPVPSWAAIMCLKRGAGFYTDLWGPMPFNFGAGRPETYVVQVVEPP